MTDITQQIKSIFEPDFRCKFHVEKKTGSKPGNYTFIKYLSKGVTLKVYGKKYLAYLTIGEKLYSVLSDRVSILFFDYDNTIICNADFLIEYELNKPSSNLLDYTALFYQEKDSPIFEFSILNKNGKILHTGTANSVYPEKSLINLNKQLVLKFSYEIFEKFSMFTNNKNLVNIDIRIHEIDFLNNKWKIKSI